MTTYELNARRESILQQLAELLNNEEAISKAERWVKRMYKKDKMNYPLALDREELVKEIGEAEDDIAHNRCITHEALLEEIKKW
nr:hypothetical protein [Parabacteroides goldsteinii]